MRVEQRLLGGENRMSSEITMQDLVAADFSESEVRAILSCTNDAVKIRLLRRGRGRLLESIHEKQQALDKLDYFVYQLRQSDSKRDKLN